MRIVLVVEGRGAAVVRGDVRWGCVSLLYRMLLTLRVYRDGVDEEGGPRAVSGAVLSMTGIISTIVSGGDVV